MSSVNVREDVVLGLDLGTTSVGWALLLDQEAEGNTTLLRTGVRHFDPGSENLSGGAIGDKAEVSNSSARRQHRSQRRQLRRRAGRLARLYRLLADAGLLPKLPVPDLQREDGETKATFHRRKENAEREARDAALKRLDEELWTRIRDNNLACKGDTRAYLPFVLRSHALDRQLLPYELGRAIYHLGQHRGFSINRAADAEEQQAVRAAEEEAGDTAKGTPKRKTKNEGGKFADALVGYRNRLNQLDERGNPQRTIGEIHYRMIQNKEVVPNRARMVTVRRQGEPAWRSMYEDEFRAIWNCQSAPDRDPSLNDKSVEERYRRSRRGGGNPDEILTRTISLRHSLEHTLFYQRPLKSAAHLIGDCDLENGLNCLKTDGTPTKVAPRLPWAHPLAQRFRMIAMVNNAALMNPDDSPERLTTAQRDNLLNLLEGSRERVKFTTARAALGLPKWAKFNFERKDSASEKSFEVASTEHLFQKAFGERWQQVTPFDRELLFHDWYSIQNPEALKLRLAVRWGLGIDSAENSELRGNELFEAIAVKQAEARDQGRAYGFKQAREDFGELRYSAATLLVANANLEAGYCNLSSRAIRRLLPLMEDRSNPQTYGEARELLYTRPPTEPLDRLKPLKDVIPELTSPIVRRCLTEMRKVVNALIEEEGYKPGRIHVEVARSLRVNKKGRKDIVDRQKLDRQANESAATIAREMNILDASGRPLVLKVKLAQECGWCCPYTGRSFGAQELINHEVEIEHIIPQSMWPGDGFENLTLAYREANGVKGDNPPHAAFTRNPAGYNWEDIIRRVARFKNKDQYAKLAKRIAEDSSGGANRKKGGGTKRGDNSHPKLRLFKLEGTRANPSPELKKHCEGFTQADLTQTAWMTKSACGYLATLYGVPVSAPHLKDQAGEGKRRIYAVGGGVTGFLRRNLGKYIKDSDLAAPQEKYWRDLNTILWPTQDIAIPGRTKDYRKSRADHRHHAIDAIVVALADHQIVNQINRANASESTRRRDQLRASVRRAAAASWPQIYDDIRTAVYGGVDSQGVEWPELVVSERSSQRLQGELHRATLLKKGKGKVFIGAGPRHRVIQNNNNPLMLVANKKSKLVGRVVSLLEALDCQRRGEQLSSLLHPDEQFQYLLWKKSSFEILNDAVQVEGRPLQCVYYINGFEAGGGTIKAAPHWWGANAEREHPASVRNPISTLVNSLQMRRVRVSVTGRVTPLESVHD